MARRGSAVALGVFFVHLLLSPWTGMISDCLFCQGTRRSPALDFASGLQCVTKIVLARCAEICGNGLFHRNYRPLRLFSEWHSRVHYSATRTRFQVATILDASESPGLVLSATPLKTLGGSTTKLLSLGT